MPEMLQDWSKSESWRAEIDRSRRYAEPYETLWNTNLKYYIGESPDAADANASANNYVNINADFFVTELKVSQLFYDTPTLTLTSKGHFKPRKPAAPPQQPSEQPS